MTKEIDFENFKNGDKVIITISGKNGEEIYPCKIIDISSTKKLIHFEDNESEYECKFSEVKSIVRTKKVIPYGILTFLYFLLFMVLAPFHIFSEYLSKTFFFLLIVIPILSFLDIWQYFRMQNDKLSVYEKQNNTPYVLSIFTCVAIYPTIFIFTLFILEDVMKIRVSWCLLGEVLVFLTWVPGLMFFIKDQIKLYQNKKKYCIKKNFWIRMVVFLVCYLFLASCGWQMIHMMV